MKEQDQIAELFKETFQGYEAPVRPELWQQVASQIQAPVTPTVPDGNSVAQITTATGKVAGSVTAWVAGAAIVVTVATGYYFMQRENSSSSNAPVIETPDSKNTSESKDSQEADINQNLQEISGQNESGSISPALSNQKGTSENSQGTISEDLTGNSSGQPVETGIIYQNSDDPASATTSQPNANAGNKASELNENSTPVSAVNAPSSEAVVSKAVIVASGTSGYAPYSVNFSTNSSLVSAEWLFGDGSEAVKGLQVQHTFTKPGTYLVTMKATAENGKITTDLTRVQVLSNLNISNIPNIFTPNGDGSNDVFAVQPNKDIDIEVNIYDQSAKFIHRFDGNESSWNGKINNIQDAEEGTYIYIIFATGQNGEKNTQKGFIILKR